jgi:hypothetical protein
VFLDGVGNQLLGQLSGLSRGKQPPDDVVTEDVENDREQLRLDVHRMSSLAATLTCLIPGRQQPVHRAY